MTRFISIALIALLSALGLVACGGGGGSSDEDQIRDVVERAFTSNDPAICDEIATTNFIQAFYNGAIADCKKDVEDTSDNPDSVEVTDISVDGDKATADVTVHGGPSDGQQVSASFVKDGDQWKIDGATVTTPTTGTTTGATTGTTATGAATTSTTSGDPLTDLFYSTIRSSVKDKGLSDQVADCIVNKLRASITPQEIAQIKAGNRPGTLGAKSRAAGEACAQAALSGN